MKAKLKKTAYFIFSLFFVPAFFTGCGHKDKKYETFIIWTDREEIVSYTELFNSVQDDVKAVVVYKSRIANSLPPARDEERPDLIIGSWLKNAGIRKYFRPLDGILSADAVDAGTFYAPLLEYGKIAGAQFLLPVSFNLPLVIFSKKNENLLTEKYCLKVDQIRDTAALFNKKNEKGLWTNMGFGPSWDDEFIYTVSKKFGPCFTEKGNSFVWDDGKIQLTADYIKNWTTEKNESTTAEQDFEFKYLYTPKYRQIEQDRTLFAYTTSGELFSIPSEQFGVLDYRWLSINGKLPVEDDIVSLGIYKKAQNPRRAEIFIKWFFNGENQRLMLERTDKMNLDTASFGIASGFSAVKSVNEFAFPIYYKNLMGNLPIEELLSAPESFPARWESLKERVVFPYLRSVIQTDATGETQSMDELLGAWLKQFD